MHILGWQGSCIIDRSIKSWNEKMLVVEILIVLFAYACGSISSAIITCQLLRLPDPRLQGSGNPGTTNVLRVGGKKAAIITLLGDVLKGVIPVLIAKLLNVDSPILALVVFAAFIGHLYPVFFQFKGGKGVATAFGCMLALSWPVGLALLFTWLIVASVSRYSSLAALIAAIMTPVYTWYFLSPVFICMASGMSLLLILRHKKNILQLINGQETKIGSKVKGLRQTD